MRVFNWLHLRELCLRNLCVHLLAGPALDVLRPTCQWQQQSGLEDWIYHDTRRWPAAMFAQASDTNRFGLLKQNLISSERGYQAATGSGVLAQIGRQLSK